MFVLVSLVTYRVFLLDICGSLQIQVAPKHPGLLCSAVSLIVFGVERKFKYVTKCTYPTSKMLKIIYHLHILCVKIKELCGVIISVIYKREWRF